MTMLLWALGQVAGIVMVVALVIALRITATAAGRFHTRGMARVNR